MENIAMKSRNSAGDRRFPRIVDIVQYMPVVRELLAQGESVSLTVTGESMAPFLRHGRDQILFSAPTKPPKRGDLVFYRRASGQYVMHRVYRRCPDGSYAMLGDGQQQVESPIAPEQIFAVVTRVCRKGKWLGPRALCWRFYAGPWLWLLPLRPALRRIGALIRRKGARNEGT